MKLAAYILLTLAAGAGAILALEHNRQARHGAPHGENPAHYALAIRTAGQQCPNVIELIEENRDAETPRLRITCANGSVYRVISVAGGQGHLVANALANSD